MNNFPSTCGDVYKSLIRGTDYFKRRGYLDGGQSEDPSGDGDRVDLDAGGSGWEGGKAECDDGGRGHLRGARRPPPEPEECVKGLSVSFQHQCD